MMVVRKQKIGVKIKGEYIMKIVLILAALVQGISGTGMMFFGELGDITTLVTMFSLIISAKIDMILAFIVD